MAIVATVSFKTPGSIIYCNNDAISLTNPIKRIVALLSAPLSLLARLSGRGKRVIATCAPLCMVCAINTCAFCVILFITQISGDNVSSP